MYIFIRSDRRRWSRGLCWRCNVGCLVGSSDYGFALGVYNRCGMYAIACARRQFLIAGRPWCAYSNRELKGGVLREGYGNSLGFSIQFPYFLFLLVRGQEVCESLPSPFSPSSGHATIVNLSLSKPVVSAKTVVLGPLWLPKSTTF